MHIVPFTEEKPRFPQIPAILNESQQYHDDAEALKSHFQEFKTQILDAMEKLYDYTRKLNTQHYTDYKKISSDIQNLITSFVPLKKEDTEKKSILSKRIEEYHEKLQKVLHFEESEDF